MPYQLAVGYCRRQAGSGHGLRAAAMPISGEVCLEVAATPEVARADDKQQWLTASGKPDRLGGGCHGGRGSPARRYVIVNF